MAVSLNDKLANYAVEQELDYRAKSVPNSFAWTLAQVPLFTLFIGVVCMQLLELSLRSTGWVCIAVWLVCNGVLTYLDRHLILNSDFEAPHILVGTLLPPVYFLMRLSGRNQAASTSGLWAFFVLLTLLIPIGSEIGATALEQSIVEDQTSTAVKGEVTCPDGADSIATNGSVIECSIRDSTGPTFKVPAKVDVDTGVVTTQIIDPSGALVTSAQTSPEPVLDWDIVCVPRAVEAAVASVLPIPQLIGGGCLIPRGMPYRPNS